MVCLGPTWYTGLRLERTDRRHWWRQGSAAADIAVATAKRSLLSSSPTTTILLNTPKLIILFDLRTCLCSEQTFFFFSGQISLSLLSPPLSLSLFSLSLSISISLHLFFSLFFIRYNYFYRIVYIYYVYAYCICIICILLFSIIMWPIFCFVCLTLSPLSRIGGSLLQSPQSIRKKENLFCLKKKKRNRVRLMFFFRH